MNKEYLSIADMMSGLMMVFLFIAVVFMVDVQHQKDKIEHQKNEIEQQKNAIESQKNAMAEIVEIAEKSRQQLHNDLLREFGLDLRRWNAEILIDNTVRFNAPKVLFKTGKSILRPKFKDILDSFFPRYVKILQNYRKDIEAIRIEGHTSSDWFKAENVAMRYLKNVKLSQQRALSTLTYCYHILKNVNAQREWLQKVLRANGLSFARRIFNTDGSENAENSRRVEFRVITKAEEKLYQILERSR
ncbi:OmpA family protein [Candidatus Parabeggiatoa sp. HSG14]|uniref:OmpA family protein n=1 Tax=Candidatus Parabeggiatoa sp. HSG14 TaxID=3055593 RepID=UPI0025A761CB|nr:OmpA family protein [Thiotrichales bacterium HSG14]